MKKKKKGSGIREKTKFLTNELLRALLHFNRIALTVDSLCDLVLN